VKEEKKPRVWLILLVLVAVVLLLVGSIGSVLVYSEAKGTDTLAKPPDSNPWGIVSDNPIRRLPKKN